MTDTNEKVLEAQLDAHPPSAGQHRPEPVEKELGMTDSKESIERDASTSSQEKSDERAIDGEKATAAPSKAPTETAARPQRPGLMRHYTKLANKEAHPWQHWGITLGLPMIVLFDLVVPITIYYSWYNSRQSSWASSCSPYWSQGQACPIERPADFDDRILGSAVASFGIGELWILLARVYRLWKHPEQCAPLLSRNRWELDATSWVYLTAMVCALIPFVVGGALVLPHLYLYGPSFLMGFLGILMAVTTFIPFKIPIGINSHPRGSGLRPFIYYAAEDFVAVDGLQDREFRIRYNRRYESNVSFRRLFVYLTILWQFGVLTYIGCVSAVIWTLPFHVAFGLSLGVLFGYIAVFAGITYIWVMIEMAKERKAYEHGEV